MEKISWIDPVRNEGLHGVKECPRYNKNNASCTGQTLSRNTDERKIQGRIKVTKIRGRRHKPLLDDLKETTGYWKLKEEGLDRTPWRTKFGKGCGSVVRQITE
jgi:hypothetical protein